jgi:hypothetical protein
MDQDKRNESMQNHQQIIEKVQTLPNLVHLSLTALKIIPTTFMIPHTVTILDLGLRYYLKDEFEDNPQKLLFLKSLTLRQMYKKKCFERFAIRVIKALIPHDGDTLIGLHIHYNILKSVESIVRHDILPKSIKVLSFESSVSLTAQFRGIGNCKNPLDTLYISGYAKPNTKHIIRSLTDYKSLTTLGLGHAVLDNVLAETILMIPNIRTVKIREGYIDIRGFNRLKNNNVSVQAGPICNVDERIKD